VIRIAFLGDICPGGVLHDSPARCLSEEVSDYLGQFDLRVGTLESAIGDRFEFDRKKTDIGRSVIYSHDADVRRLVEIGLDVASLANNHVTDLGRDGLLNTLKVLDTHGIKHVGAGRSIDEARKPAVIDLDGRRLSFLAFYDTKVAPHPASEAEPGVRTSDDILRSVGEAKRQSDYVFVLPHWGFENIHRPLPDDHRLGRRVIRSGADGVFGCHAHQVQPWMPYRRRPIFFSLGNFLFPDYYSLPSRVMCYPDGRADGSGGRAPKTECPDAIKAVKCVWRPEARVGMIADVRIDDRLEVGYRLTWLTQDNQVTFLRDSTTLVRALTALGHIARSPMYPQFFLMSRLYFYFRRRLPE